MLLDIHCQRNPLVFANKIQRENIMGNLRVELAYIKFFGIIYLIISSICFPSKSLKQIRGKDRTKSQRLLLTIFFRKIFSQIFKATVLNPILDIIFGNISETTQCFSCLFLVPLYIENFEHIFWNIQAQKNLEFLQKKSQHFFCC